jgi:hypothetical protein
MANWDQWVEDDNRPHTRQKPDKNQYCRKNKTGNTYGPHLYDNNRCTFCFRLKEKNHHQIVEKDNTQGETNEDRG